MTFNTGPNATNPQTGASVSSTTPLPPNTPTQADRTVLMAGLMGLRPTRRPELSTQFATSGGSQGSGVGRKPGVAKRTLIGGN